MALIKCSECSAEISDKASCCPKCGAPVVVHKWRCSKCGNMISEEPCPYCSNAQTAINTVAYGSSVSTTPAFVAKNKRNLKALITVLVIAAVAMIIIVFMLQNSGSSTNPDPNRTQEDCTFFGTANVYPASHANGNCHPDGDGYYWPGFGHHHHK